MTNVKVIKAVISSDGELEIRLIFQGRYFEKRHETRWGVIYLHEYPRYSYAHLKASCLNDLHVALVVLGNLSLNAEVVHSEVRAAFAGINTWVRQQLAAYIN